jgi:hypothetical protein
MDRYCSTGQSPQRAVAPTEEEEEELFIRRQTKGWKHTYVLAYDFGWVIRSLVY